MRACIRLQCVVCAAVCVRLFWCSHGSGVFLAVIGVVWTLKLVSNVAKFAFITFLRPGKNIKKLGSWAVCVCA